MSVRTCQWVGENAYLCSVIFERDKKASDGWCLPSAAMMPCQREGLYEQARNTLRPPSIPPKGGKTGGYLRQSIDF